MVVQLPPDNATDAAGWASALLTDLAGDPDLAAELLEVVWDIQTGRVAEWSMQYNVYGIEMLLGGARVTFIGESCPVPLETLVAVVNRHLRLSAGVGDARV